MKPQAELFPFWVGMIWTFTIGVMLAHAFAPVLLYRNVEVKQYIHRIK